MGLILRLGGVYETRGDSDHLLQIYKERFMSEAADWIEKPRGYLNFERDLPHITPESVSQIEYDTEWFPAKL